MALTRKHLMILAAILGLLALTACTREITTIVQEQPQPSSCFECHSDTDLSVLRAQTEWVESRHGEGETVFEGTNASCVRCHANEGFIQYVDGVTTYTATTTPTNINCFTCHAPHTNGDFGLRITAPRAPAERRELRPGPGQYLSGLPPGAPRRRRLHHVEQQHQQPLRPAPRPAGRPAVGQQRLRVRRLHLHGDAVPPHDERGRLRELPHAQCRAPGRRSHVQRLGVQCRGGRDRLQHRRLRGLPRGHRRRTSTTTASRPRSTGCWRS